MNRMSRMELQQTGDFKVINFEDFTVPVNDEKENICVDDVLVSKMIKKKKNLFNLSEFLKQLEADNRFLLNEQLKNKVIYKIKVGSVKSTIEVLKEDTNMREEVIDTALNHMECTSISELKTNLYKYEDLLEEANAEIMILKSDISRIKLDRKKLAYIIQNGVSSNSDLNLLKRYNFSSFCQ